MSTVSSSSTALHDAGEVTIVQAWRLERERARATVVHCAGGYRSSIAAGVMAAAGFTDVSDLVGGYEGVASAGERPR
ncbi:MAG: hypothetical protein JOY80_04455 [Candidatus Dormibacteraeota bacterium]|nr:hypothetical protein [Candidatus Dormibacteraeota bacterium]